MIVNNQIKSKIKIIKKKLNKLKELGVSIDAVGDTIYFIDINKCYEAQNRAKQLTDSGYYPTLSTAIREIDTETYIIKSVES